MARITGKNAKIRGVLARTTISVAEALTNSGDNLTYVLTGKPYWNPNLPPVVRDNAVVVSPSEYSVDYVNGQVTFFVARNPLNTIDVNGIEWMTLQDVGDMFDWTLDLKVDVVDATAFMDQFKTNLSSFRGWVASAQGYHVSGYWFDAFSGSNAEFYVEFYPNGAGTERFIGAGFVDMALDVKRDSAVTEKMTINGTGALVRKTT
jgi:hypothetical protein